MVEIWTSTLKEDLGATCRRLRGHAAGAGPCSVLEEEAQGPGDGVESDIAEVEVVEAHGTDGRVLVALDGMAVNAGEEQERVVEEAKAQDDWCRRRH